MREQVVTFKVDNDLYGLLKNIPNKSEFIRNSIFKALNNICPLCNGAGTLNSCQQKHWAEFGEHHQLEKCDDCKSVYLTCERT
ncbi:MAG: CopG family transcriptional regulator [Spirochaetales bacterium]|nr:CopG family transcriptional regulator [Spirochaetales bacterium]